MESIAALRAQLRDVERHLDQMPPHSASRSDLEARRADLQRRLAAARAPRRSGAERIEGLAAGDVELPGMWATVGIRLVDIGPGHATVEGTADERFSNGSGRLHGGLVATMADCATGAALRTTIEQNDLMATLDLGVTYLRRVDLDGRSVRAVAHVVRSSTRMGHVTCEVEDADGQVVATARATYAITRR